MNENGERNSGREGNLSVKETIRRLQKPVGRNEKYKKIVDTKLWREGSNKIENSETESSVSMQGTRLYRKSFEERQYNQTRNGLNDWMLYGEKQPHDLSKTLQRNELKDLRSYLRQNIAAQIQLT